MPYQRILDSYMLFLASVSYQTLILLLLQPYYVSPKYGRDILFLPYQSVSSSNFVSAQHLVNLYITETSYFDWSA